VFLADEDDTVVDDKARTLLASVLRARAALPAQPTYAGGASNRYTGAYAGITDVKGMDAYIGACAPHYALLPMPARGAYDYLANTRANHAPGPPGSTRRASRTAGTRASAATARPTPRRSRCRWPPCPPRAPRAS